MRYPTVEDLGTLPTRGEIAYDLATVTWPDGSPVHLKLRALDARAQAAVDREAAKAGAKHGIDYDHATAMVKTVFLAIAEPKLEEHHESILWGWNAWILSEIADQIAILGRLPARDLQSALERLAGVAIPDAPAKPSTPRRTKRGRGVDHPDSE